MSSLNQESQKKSSNVLEKLGKRVSNIKEDIVDNIERRRQSHGNINSTQTHITNRTSMTDESLIIDKKPPTPPESHIRRSSGKNRKKEK